MTADLHFFVPGSPAPQGSKSFKGIRGGRGILVESSKAVKPWRHEIESIARLHCNSIETVPVGIQLSFVMPRPKSTPRHSTPPAIKRTGDVDKLARAVLDALTGIAYADDCQVIGLRCSKRIAEVDESPGVSIELDFNVVVLPLA